MIIIIMVNNNNNNNNNKYYYWNQLPNINYKSIIKISIYIIFILLYIL